MDPQSILGTLLFQDTRITDDDVSYLFICSSIIYSTILDYVLW